MVINWKLEQFLVPLQNEIEAAIIVNQWEVHPGNQNKKKTWLYKRLWVHLKKTFNRKIKASFRNKTKNFVYFVKRNIIVIYGLKLKILMIVERFWKGIDTFFKCMKPVHSKVNCKSRANCFKCQLFDHHPIA